MNRRDFLSRSYLGLGGLALSAMAATTSAPENPLPNLATRADDMAFIHGVKVDNNNHGPAVYHTLTGNMFPGSASVGAWVTYGLGSENQSLPGFIVLGDKRGAPIGGSSVWGNGFLPAAYQGTLFRSGA